MDKRIISLVVGLMVVIVLGLGAVVVTQMGGSETDGLTTTMEGGFDGSAVDSAARIEIEKLRQQIEGLQQKVQALEDQVSNLGASGAGGFTEEDRHAHVPRDGPNQILDSYAQVVLIAGRRDLNQGISVATPSFLEQTLGRPRETLNDQCQAMTNPKLKSMLVVERVGPIRVQMLQPAIDSLKRVFAKIEATDPDLYARINTAGSLCVRQIRGSQGRLSTHSFGLSVDLNIDGKLDTLGDGKTQLGLTILADFFRNEGWYWGAGFSREDSMHFEVSREMIEQWRAEGRI